MSDMSEQPSTWSYKTTKILVICFVFFIIIPIIGFTTESNSFETLTNPEKSHPSHMMELENNLLLYFLNIFIQFIQNQVLIQLTKIIS